MDNVFYRIEYKDDLIIFYYEDSDIGHAIYNKKIKSVESTYDRYKDTYLIGINYEDGDVQELYANSFLFDEIVKFFRKKT